MSFTLPSGVKIEGLDPEKLQDPDVQKLLHDVMSTLDENPLQKFHPHRKQESFMGSVAKTKVFVGGTRSGKSTAGVLYDLIQLVDDKMVPEHLKHFKRWQPPVKARVIVPDLQRTLPGVLETFQKWVPQSQLRGGSWDSAWREKDSELHFANGSFVDFLSLEMKTNKFGGVTRHIVHYDEEPQGEHGEKIRWDSSMRMAEVNGEELFTYSPTNGLGWTHDDFEENKGAESEKGVWPLESSEEYPLGLIVVRASIHDNPHMSREGINAALAKIPQAVRASYEEGNYTHFKGLVYPEFSAEIHVVDESKIDTDRIRPLVQVDGIDPGQQTTAVLFAGFDQEGRMLIYDEYKASGTSAIPANCAERIFDIREKWGLPPEPKLRLIDPSAWTRELATGKRIDMAWREAGMKVMPAQNEVEAGVFEVMRRMDFKDAEGNKAPMILISSRCTHLLKEIGKYRLNPKEDGSFGVVKKEDHFCDVMRYIAMSKQLAKERRKGRKQQTERGWTPGTAPPFKPRKKISKGIGGKYS